MTRERLAEAEEAGRRATSYGAFLFSDTCRTKGGMGLHMYEVTVTTPFASVAYAVFESKKKKSPMDLASWPLDPPEKQSLIITVDPAALYPAELPPVPPHDVAKVFLRRGGQITEPIRSDTHEVLFPAAGGQVSKHRGGAFYFPLASFASADGDLEIVVIPAEAEQGAEAVLKIKKKDLVKLR